MLKTHSENPDLIGVLDMNFLLKVNEFVIKEWEIMAFAENIELYQDSSDLLEESIDAYVLFSKNSRDTIPLGV